MRGRYEKRKRQAEVIRNPPVVLDMHDDADAMPGLRQFRDKLLAIVRRRDIQALAPMLHDEVCWDARSSDPDGLLREIEQDPELWWEWLEEALAPGGHWLDATEQSNMAPPETFVSPAYLARKWPGPPRSNMDISQSAWIRHAQAALYADVDGHSIIRPLLMYELVFFREWPNGRLTPIETANGQMGFAPCDALQVMDTGYFMVHIDWHHNRWGVSFASAPGIW